MAGFPCVHHIEIGAVDGEETVRTLTSQILFKVKAVRHTPVASQWLLVKNKAQFLVTSLKTTDPQAIKKDSYVTNWVVDLPSTHTSSLPTTNSVFNVAFQVKDINSCLQRLKEHQAELVKPLVEIHDDQHGSVRVVVVKSCVGDIQHTLVEKRGYTGDFLPGFKTLTTAQEPDSYKTLTTAQETDSSSDSLIENFDHIAFSAARGTTVDIIDWYQRCFGMKKFLINSLEDSQDGLVLANEGVGLRLRAMQYWKCSEVGLSMPDEQGLEFRLPIVIGEGLPPTNGGQEEDQIACWLRKHGGPGIQHVALTSSNIKASITTLRQAGLPFANPPPPTYYSEVGRLGDILWAGEDAKDLEDNGILIDTEADGIYLSKEQHSNGQDKHSYLLQIFTRPVLPGDPFFLEVIQRKGATGFGSGNVAALYRSVQAFIVGD